MRKLVLLGVAALLAAPAVASVDDDFLALTGQIDYQCDVTMLGQASATVNMYLIGSSQTLAQVRYVCNDPQGFFSRVKSTNNSALKNGTHVRNYLASMSGGGVSAINFAPLALTAAGVTNNAAGFQAAAAAAPGTVHDFAITLQPGAPLPGGINLTDQIIFEVDGL
jgi:hypothetical protein